MSGEISLVRKAMIIGLDSAVPDFIRRFAEEGILPNMKMLMDKGVYGEGFCTYPSLTGTNWTSIVCGTWPGTQGTSHMWTHFPGDPLNRVRSSFLSTSSHCEPLWEAGEKVGKRSIIMKYPCTVPPTIKKGIQVEGSGAPWYGLDPFEVAPCMCFSNQVYPNAEKVELKPASGWINVPDFFSEALEGVVEVRSKSAESGRAFNILLIDSKGSGYDEMLISRSKDGEDSVARLSAGEWSEWLREEFDARIPLYIKYREDSKTVYEDTPVKRHSGTFRFKLVDLSTDASSFRLYQSQVFPTTGFTWPESIAGELMENVGPFQEHIGPTADFNNWIDDETFLEELEYQSRWLGSATSYIMSNYEWDLYFLQWHGFNHAEHTFWGGIDPVSPWFKEENAPLYWEYFKRFYRAADEMIGKILEKADDETLVVVTADHGHIPYVYGAAMVGNALINEGLLAYRKDAEGEMAVDWARTKAYSQPEHVYVNLKGRDPDGIVDKGVDYETVCDRIISALYGIRDPEGRCPIAFALRKNEAEMIGLYGDRVGDVVYCNSAGFISLLEPTDDLEEFKFVRGAISPTDDWGDRSGPIPANTSIHGSNMPSSRLGLGSMMVPLILCGPDIKRGYMMRNRFLLIDIAPTVSHILEMPLPSHCEGSVILEALS